MTRIWQDVRSPIIKAGENPTAEFVFWADEETNEATVLADFLSEVGDTYGPLGLSRSEVVVEATAREDLWRISTTYSLRGAVDSQIEFDTSGGSAHIQHSLQTIAAYGSSPPNFHNAIGVNGDRIDGCDKTVPVFNFSIRARVANTILTGAYIIALRNLTGKVNNAEFYGFAAGEVLFLGASGSRTGSDNYTIQYKFAASENATGLSVGSISGIAKKGWEYLWIRFREDVDENSLIKRPVHVYVERIYEFGDFSVLGI
mgnify:CR=1 FL=1